MKNQIYWEALTVAEEKISTFAGVKHFALNEQKYKNQRSDHLL